MSRIGITYEQVESAAEKILTEGASPTIEKIRQALGSTGSNSTIAKYLNEWKSQRLVHARNKSPVILTPPDPVNAAVSRVWEQIREESNKEIDVIRERSQKEVELAQQELQQKVKACSHLQNELDTLYEKTNALSAQKELLSLELKKSQQALELQQERYQALSEQFKLSKQKLETHLTDIKELHKAELAKTEKHLQAMEKSYHTLLTELKNQHQLECAQYVAQINEMNKLIEMSNKKIVEAENKFNLEHTAFIQYKMLYEEAKKKLAEVINEKHVLQKQLDAQDSMRQNVEHLNESSLRFFSKMLEHANAHQIQLAEVAKKINEILEFTLPKKEVA